MDFLDKVKKISATLIVLGLIANIILSVEKDYSKNIFYMDTYINVKIKTSGSKYKANNILNEVENIYKKYQDLTNVYDEKSDISIINDNNSNKNYIEVNKDIYKMLELGLEWNKKSNNKFNLNMGCVIKVWKKYRDSNKGIPSDNELNNCNSDINNLVLLGNNRIKNNELNLDLGAIAKGYATEEVGKYLEKKGISNYIINAGGNVLVGKKGNSEKYKVGIQSPTEENGIYTIINVNNKAIVTSGGYERFYEYEGKKYHHIIDPDTNYPSNNMLSVTVITKSSTLADILSTTLFLLKPEEAINLVDTLDDVECIIITNDNTSLTSKGYNKYE